METGNALNHNALNKALAFFPAEYNVKLGQDTRSASVEAGQTTRVKVLSRQHKTSPLPAEQSSPVNPASWPPYASLPLADRPVPDNA